MPPNVSLSGPLDFGGVQLLVIAMSTLSLACFGGSWGMMVHTGVVVISLFCFVILGFLFVR